VFYSQKNHSGTYSGLFNLTFHTISYPCPESLEGIKNQNDIQKIALTNNSGETGRGKQQQIDKRTCKV